MKTVVSINTQTLSEIAIVFIEMMPRVLVYEMLSICKYWG